MEKKYFAITKWSAEDVLYAAEELEIKMTKEEAQRWLKENERFLLDTIILFGNNQIYNMLEKGNTNEQD